MSVPAPTTSPLEELRPLSLVVNDEVRGRRTRCGVHLRTLRAFNDTCHVPVAESSPYTLRGWTGDCTGLSRKPLALVWKS